MTSAELPGVAPDVLVVGAGNAALCAGISAHQNGARVLMLEAAPFEERGGNSHFTGGAFRFAFAGVDDLLAVLPSLAQERLENVDFGTYTQDQFFDDLFALTQYRSDPDLLEILVRGSLDTAKWIAQQGVKLQPGLGRQAYQVDGKFKFWGGLALHIWGGGPELRNALYANVERRGISILYETPATSLIKGEVEDLYGRIIPGLYAAGEMVGGLFFHNYASGTGLMSGATFGRLAGRSAAAFARPPASRAAQVRHDAEGAAP